MSVKVVNNGTGEKCTIDGKPIEGELNLNKLNNVLQGIGYYPKEGTNYGFDNEPVGGFYLKNGKFMVLAASGGVNDPDLKEYDIDKKSYGKGYGSIYYYATCDNYVVDLDRKRIIDTTAKNIKNFSFYNDIVTGNVGSDDILHNLYFASAGNLYRLSLSTGTTTSVISIPSNVQPRHNASLPMCFHNNKIYTFGSTFNSDKSLKFFMCDFTKFTQIPNINISDNLPYGTSFNGKIHLFKQRNHYVGDENGWTQLNDLDIALYGGTAIDNGIVFNGVVSYGSVHIYKLFESMYY